MPAEITRNEWIAVTGNEGYSIFIDPDFLDPIASVFGYSIKYYVNFLKAKPVVGFACFVSGRKIVVPTHFIYSGVWYNIKPDTIKFRNILIELLEFMKKEYKSIDFRLPPHIKDLRPFQWNGFSSKINYTYIRTTSDLNFEYNVRSRVKKAQELGILPAVGNDAKEVWQHQQYDLRRFHFYSSLLTKLESLFFAWFQKGFLRIYKAEINSGIQGSAFVLVDKGGSRAYNLLISSANSNYHTGIHASLYNFIFEDLKRQEIGEFDLYGADLRGVSDFKASLGAQLQSHYTVSYKYRDAKMQQIKKLGKEKLLKLRSRLF